MPTERSPQLCQGNNLVGGPGGDHAARHSPDNTRGLILHNHMPPGGANGQGTLGAIAVHPRQDHRQHSIAQGLCGRAEQHIDCGAEAQFRRRIVERGAEPVTDGSEPQVSPAGSQEDLPGPCGNSFASLSNLGFRTTPGEAFGEELTEPREEMGHHKDRDGGVRGNLGE